MIQRGGPLLLVGLCGACPPSECADLVGAPTVEVGTGLVRFEPLAEGAIVEVVHGPQGGYHVLGALLAHGIWPGDVPDTWPEVEFGLRSDDGLIADVTEPAKRRFAALDDAWVLTAELVVLNLTSFDGVDGTPATLSARVTDACANEATDLRTIVLVPAE